MLYLHQPAGVGLKTHSRSNLVEPEKIHPRVPSVLLCPGRPAGHHLAVRLKFTENMNNGTPTPVWNVHDSRGHCMNDVPGSEGGGWAATGGNRRLSVSLLTVPFFVSRRAALRSTVPGRFSSMGVDATVDPNEPARCLGTGSTLLLLRRVPEAGFGGPT